MAELQIALSALRRPGGLDLDDFAFEPVDGGSQSSVWRGRSATGSGDVAVRISARSREHLTRLGRLKASLTSVPAPRTLAVAELPDWSATVELASWLETSARLPPDWLELGRTLSRLHTQMEASAWSLEDRPFSISESARPGDDTPWERAITRHSPAIRAWRQLRRASTGVQTIHGDVHPGNLLRVQSGYAVLDFDKVMHGPRLFDLAKLIATSCFSVDSATEVAIFDHESAAQMIDGYHQTSPLSGVEHAAVAGACLLVNRATAEGGQQVSDPGAVVRAGAMGRWWQEHPDVRI